MVEAQELALAGPAERQILRQSHQPVRAEVGRAASGEDVIDDRRRQIGNPQEQGHVPLALAKTRRNGVHALIGVGKQEVLRCEGVLQ